GRNWDGEGAGGGRGAGGDVALLAMTSQKGRKQKAEGRSGPRHGGPRTHREFDRCLLGGARSLGRAGRAAVDLPAAPPSRSRIRTAERGDQSAVIRERDRA